MESVERELYRLFGSNDLVEKILSNKNQTLGDILALLRKAEIYHELFNEAFLDVEEDGRLVLIET
jgi:hypothetical protein